MTFIIALLLGFYLGFKYKGALVLFKETKNIKYIQAVVEKVLSDKPIQIIQSREEQQTELDNKALEREHKIKKFRVVQK
jgi:hypothetical protein